MVFTAYCWSEFFMNDTQGAGSLGTNRWCMWVASDWVDFPCVFHSRKFPIFITALHVWRYVPYDVERFVSCRVGMRVLCGSTPGGGNNAVSPMGSVVISSRWCVCDAWLESASVGDGVLSVVVAVFVPLFAMWWVVFINPGGVFVLGHRHIKCEVTNNENTVLIKYCLTISELCGCVDFVDFLLKIGSWFGMGFCVHWACIFGPRIAFLFDGCPRWLVLAANSKNFIVSVHAEIQVQCPRCFSESCTSRPNCMFLHLIGNYCHKYGVCCSIYGAFIRKLRC